MSEHRKTVVDGNGAAASVAYRANEVIAIYPITPASPMGELCDEWSAGERPNAWGQVPRVVEMQSEGGAAGAVHGALQAGALTTTFTASQGLLLMLPNMYKIAGELTSFCLHVAARTVATHALSIFGDHSDVMACRQSGFAMLASSSVQAAHDLAAVAHAATLRSRVPFLHFMDGFRTSHELAKIDLLSDDELRVLMPDELRRKHRDRALTPDHPVIRGTAQNPDTFFQAREACNSYYLACPDIVAEVMDAFAELTGRRYRLFEYTGHLEAERVVVVMGSAAEAAHETVDRLVEQGERVGLLEVRLYRPFSVAHLLAALPRSARIVSVLDRTKEPGAPGEPLFLDVLAAIREGVETGMGPDARVVGGRYGLSSKELTPAMVRAVFDDADSVEPRRSFTVGIVDDLTRLSLPIDESFEIEADDVQRAVFFGLGSDGTVGATKNTVKIIAEEEGRWAQGYFEYDSKKAGAMTVSHLRFAPRPIRSSYRIREASFVACHQYSFLDRYEVLELARPGATVLLNAPHDPSELWDLLPREAQQVIVERRLRVFVIDADGLARAAGFAGRINTIMQTCFFALSEVMPRADALDRIRAAIQKTYGGKSDELVRRNFELVDQALDHLHEIAVPEASTTSRVRPPTVAAEAPDFVQRVTAMMLARRGDLLPVSAFPVDGTWPLGTSRWEKRSLAYEIPVWDAELCIQCNKCAMVCPHAAIRAKVYEPAARQGAPQAFKSSTYKAPELEGLDYTIQVAPEDCTGCTLCVRVCPAKDKSNPRHKALDLAPLTSLVETERTNYDFFLGLPEVDRARVKSDLKGSQLLQPLFEYSGACVGCGETPYVKLLTQLYGDRALIANATGCSSIYGGNLPTTPYTTDAHGRGPAWSNSLFEDNAEFGLGMRLAVDQLQERARAILRGLRVEVGAELCDSLSTLNGVDEEQLQVARSRVDELRGRLGQADSPQARELGEIADYLVPKSVWIVGGDGWAYDIGFGGVDHVLASGANVNLLVLDTEVYSNTGGQQSKATPIGASAKFAIAGKAVGKKDLGMIAMTYGNVYVASVAFGAKDAQSVKVFHEAEAYPGPSLILAYSHCIAHGFDLSFGLDQQKLAVESGHWPLYRFDPRRVLAGQNPLIVDSGSPRRRIEDFARNENRYRIVERRDPERFRELMRLANDEANRRFSVYRQLAELKLGSPPDLGGEGRTES